MKYKKYLIFFAIFSSIIIFSDNLSLSKNDIIDTMVVYIQGDFVSKKYIFKESLLDDPLKNLREKYGIPKDLITKSCYSYNDLQKILDRVIFKTKYIKKSVRGNTYIATIFEKKAKKVWISDRIMVFDILNNLFSIKYFFKIRHRYKFFINLKAMRPYPDDFYKKEAQRNLKLKYNEFQIRDHNLKHFLATKIIPDLVKCGYDILNYKNYKVYFDIGTLCSLGQFVLFYDDKGNMLLITEYYSNWDQDYTKCNFYKRFVLTDKKKIYEFLLKEQRYLFRYFRWEIY